MKLNLAVKIDVDAEDDDVAERIADIAQEEARKFAAALIQRLDDEGIDDIEVNVTHDG